MTYVFIVWRDPTDGTGWDKVSVHNTIQGARAALVKDIPKWTLPYAWKITIEAVEE